MDFITQVKKVREITKSPRVKELCENFLNGGGISKDELIAAINDQNTTLPETQTISGDKNYQQMKLKEEGEISKRLANQLMESWAGLNTSTPSNSGTWIKQKESGEQEKMLVESLNSLAHIDPATQAFVEAQELRHLGLMKNLQKLKESSIYDYPAAKILCEQYNHLITAKGIPEFMLVENFIHDLKQLSWDKIASDILLEMQEIFRKHTREIEVAKVLEAIKNSGNSSFYSELKESLNNWLVSENKSTGMLVKSISKYGFNPVVRNLINYLNVYESDDSRRLELPEVSQGESRVERVFSPVIIEEGVNYFQIGGYVFEATEEGIRRISTKEISSLNPEFIKTLQIMSKPYVRVNENGVFVQLGKKTVRLVEEGEGVSVYLGSSKLNFGHLSGLAKILGLESSAHFGVNESQVVGDILNLYQAIPNIVELDFAKSVISNIYEGVAVNLIKWNGKLILQRINESMKENSLYEVNGGQAVKMVKEFLRYDISEGLTEFLDGEQKIRSIMFNDRSKVLENIKKVENEIAKINGVMEANSFYKGAPQIQQAKKILERELVVLREKWNQINSEIRKFEDEEMSEVYSDVNEDQKFNIGDFIKVKESGETGKIISIDNTSGRYTVMMDNGKTGDFLINEIVDLEEALSKAGEENEQKAKDEEEGEGVKEANNFNKSNLSIEEQKQLLSKFANMHGFSKAPKPKDNDAIELELDQVHGYNLTMNEAKEKAEKSNPAPDFSKAPGDSKIGKGKDANKGNVVEAPGNDKKNKGKVEGSKSLATAPENKDKTEFDGEDESGNSYEIGYNLREGEDSNLADAPETGKKVKETKGTTSTNLVEAPDSGKNAKETNANTSKLVKKQSLTQAPGKEGDIDFEVNDESGYNLSEAEADVKKN